MSDAEIALLLADCPDPSPIPAPPPSMSPEQQFLVELHSFWNPMVPIAEQPAVVVWAWAQRVLANLETGEERVGFRRRLRRARPDVQYRPRTTRRS